MINTQLINGQKTKDFVVIILMINKMALSKPMQFRSKAGRKIVVWGYSLSQKIYGFN